MMINQQSKLTNIFEEFITLQPLNNSFALALENNLVEGYLHAIIEHYLVTKVPWQDLICRFA